MAAWDEGSAAEDSYNFRLSYFKFGMIMLADDTTTSSLPFQEDKMTHLVLLFFQRSRAYI